MFAGWIRAPAPEAVMRLTPRVLIAIALCPAMLWAQQPVPETGAADCTVLHSPDDRSLFQFVETRARVNFDDYAGQPVKNIRYVVLPIFDAQDPGENNWFYLALNRLHFHTRPSTLRKQMIIEPGQALDPDRLRENERLLRENDYLVDAMILPAEVCADGISLLVVARDVWTLSPSASASRSGGDNSTGAGLSEKNLFGTGQRLALGYFQDADRNGYGVNYANPQLFSRHTQLEVEYFDTSDGLAYGAELTKPFYQLDTRWAAGASFGHEELEETIEVNDIEINRYQYTQTSRDAWLGWSPGLKNDRVHRWMLGFTLDETDYTSVTPGPSFPPEDQRLRYPWVGWEYLEDRYWVATNISRSNRQEDIPLGTTLTVQAGYASRQNGSSREAVIGNVEASHTASIGDHHLMQIETYVNGLYDVQDDAPDGLFFGAEAHYYFFINALNRWYARAAFDGGRNLSVDEQITTGGGDSLRGYPSDIQRGNRRWLVTVERRRFTDIHLLNLAWLGGAAYVDAGRTWDTEGPALTDNDRTLSNLGLGLRLSPSKFRVERVLHLDVAFPLVERDRVDDYQIIVAGRVEF